MPNGVALQEGPSTLDSVNASWEKPNGTVDRYEISCDSGYADPVEIQETGQNNHSASCKNVTTPGGTVIMTVVVIVDGNEAEMGAQAFEQRATSVITLVAG